MSIEKNGNFSGMVITKKIKRAIGLVSDIHFGSYYSLCPDNFELKSGNILKINDGQAMILDYWYRFIRICDELNVDTFFFAGDMVHGQNRKESGINLITTDLNVQQKMAMTLIEPVLKGRKSYWCAGSGYHASTPGHDPDESLCEKLGNKPDIHAEWLGNVALLRIGGKRISLVSHGGGGAFVYRETSMGREIQWAKMAFANQKLPKIDLFIHGHWHWFSYLHEYDAHFVQLPCWIAYEPAPIFTKNYTRFQPDIGGAVLLLDDEDRITVWHYLYPLPHIVDEIRDI